MTALELELQFFLKAAPYHACGARILRVFLPELKLCFTLHVVLVAEHVLKHVRGVNSTHLNVYSAVNVLMYAVPLLGKCWEKHFHQSRL